MHTCFLHTWTPLALPWRCCWSFTISRSLQQSFLSSFSSWAVDLVGLGRFELDHPALRCFFFVLHFYFILIFKGVQPSPDQLYQTFDLVQIFLPFNCSLLHLLLFLPVDDCAGFFSWSWHDCHRRAPAWQYYTHETLFLELGMSNLPSYLSENFNMSISFITPELCMFVCKMWTLPLCLENTCR